MTVKVCKEIGNYNLFLIEDCPFLSSKSAKENAGESLILIDYLLTKCSGHFFTDETNRRICTFVDSKLQGQEM